MPHHTSSAGIARVTTVVVVAFVAVSLAVASIDPAIGWIIPIALGGGAVIAAVLHAAQSRGRHAAPSPDSFVHEGANIINFAHVRVAGIGGLALVLVTAVVALQYQVTSVVLAAGVIGGAVAGIVMILYRRRHGNSPS
jgi:hypothetical protein